MKITKENIANNLGYKYRNIYVGQSLYETQLDLLCQRIQ